MIGYDWTARDQEKLETALKIEGHAQNEPSYFGWNLAATAWEDAARFIGRGDPILRAKAIQRAGVYSDRAEECRRAAQQLKGRAERCRIERSRYTRQVA